MLSNRRFDPLAAGHQLPDAEIADGILKVMPLTNAVPEEAEALMRQPYALLAHVKVTDLLAPRELGRVERTLFTLEWLQNPELRRRLHVGLNKIEAETARSNLRKQRYRASGLNLVVAAIVLWNTVYLERAIKGAARGWSVGQEFAPDTPIALGLAAHQSHRRLCLARQ